MMAMQTEPVSVAPALRPLRAWTLHLWAFVLPLVNATFLLTGPHSWWAALLWTGPIWILVLLDNGSKPDRRQPTADTPNWPFDLQVYVLTAIQVMNHVLLGVMASKIAVWPLAELGTAFANLVAVLVVSGTTAGYSGIVIAHEWIHRRSRHQFLLGRMLLALVLYEHFATEHVRGHHPRIGTRKDPATARFGETLREFIRRTIPAQFVSAWRLEKVRLGDESGKLTLSQWLQHRVLQGLVAEVLLLVAFGWFFGIVAVVFFFMQARSSIVLLETVNYIEHWGLTRQGKKVTGLDSWDTENYFTLYTLVGLSRHADHHAQASRPFQKLRHFQESPKMPHGYYGTILMAMFKNEGYRTYATEELRRRQLGPFRQSDAPVPADAPVAAA